MSGAKELLLLVVVTVQVTAIDLGDFVAMTSDFGKQLAAGQSTLIVVPEKDACAECYFINGGVDVTFKAFVMFNGNTGETVKKASTMNSLDTAGVLAFHDIFDSSLMKKLQACVYDCLLNSIIRCQLIGRNWPPNVSQDFHPDAESGDRRQPEPQQQGVHVQG